MPDKIAHPDFAKRLELACDGNNDVPPINYGRLVWFVNQLEKHEVKVTPEGVRKWFVGDVRPRQKAMVALSKILKVDEAWLATGSTPEFGTLERKRNILMGNGASNVVAGLIQMAGNNVTFPTDDDQAAKDRKIDFYAVIRGARYGIHVVSAVGKGDKEHFVVPLEARETIVLALSRETEFDLRIHELDWEGVEEIGKRKSGGFEVAIGDREWRKITTFTERL